MEELEGNLKQQRKNQILERYDGGQLKFKSKFMARIMKEDITQKQREAEEKMKVQKLKEKKMSYAKYVKEIHYPEAS